jgi:hypothetical protein
VSQAEGYGEVDQEKAKLFPPKSFGFTSKPLASLEGLLWPGSLPDAQTETRLRPKAKPEGSEAVANI